VWIQRRSEPKNELQRILAAPHSSASPQDRRRLFSWRTASVWGNFGATHLQGCAWKSWDGSFTAHNARAWSFSPPPPPIARAPADFERDARLHGHFARLKTRFLRRLDEITAATWSTVQASATAGDMLDATDNILNLKSQIFGRAPLLCLAKAFKAPCNHALEAKGAAFLPVDSALSPKKLAQMPVSRCLLGAAIAQEPTFRLRSFTVRSPLTPLLTLARARLLLQAALLFVMVRRLPGFFSLVSILQQRQQDAPRSQDAAAVSVHSPICGLADQATPLDSTRRVPTFERNSTHHPPSSSLP